MLKLSSRNKRYKPNKLIQADLRKYRPGWIMKLTLALVSATTLIGSLWLGAVGKTFSIPTQALLMFSVDPDTQLAFLGFVNSITTLMITTTLEQVAGVWISRSMITGNGVLASDLDVGEEMTKPWKAIGAFIERCRSSGCTWNIFAHFLLTLSVSVCLAGLGVAINTVAIPKERWLPAVNTALPMTTFQSFDWSIFWDLAATTFGSRNPAITNEFQYAILGANAFEALMALPAGMTATPYGWHDLSRVNPDIPPAVVGLDTRINGTTTRGYGWQGAVLSDIFHYMQTHGSGDARTAIGMTGVITIAAPTISVTCGSFNVDEFPTVIANQPWNGTVFTNDTLANVQGQPALQVSIKPLPALNFTGCSCLLDVGRMLFPCSAWIINQDGAEGNVAFSANAFGASVNATGSLLPYEAVDTGMAKALNTGLSIIFGQFDRFVSSLTAGEVLVTTMRALQDERPDFTASDPTAMAPLLALLASHMIAVAGWGYNHTNSSVIDASRSQIRWQVYGSSPRLAWEWASSFILAVLLITVVTSITFMLVTGISPGEWLTLRGMLVAANFSSNSLTRLDESRGDPLPDLRVRLGRKSSSDDIVMIVKKDSAKSKPEIGKTYTWKDKNP